MDFSSYISDGMPWYVVVALSVISLVLGHLAARGASKDTSQSKLVEQTVVRQQQLDQRQQKMMDDLQEEVGRFRDEMLQIRKELDNERTKNSKLGVKVDTLTSELNLEKEKVEILSRENNELKTLVSELKEENRTLRELLEELEK